MDQKLSIHHRQFPKNILLNSKLNKYDFNESGVTLESSPSEMSRKRIDIVCSFKKPSKLICMNNKCNNIAFVCSQSECGCRKLHLKCMKTELQSFLDNLQLIPVSIQIFEQFIDDKIQFLIDKLSDFRENVIVNLKKKFEFFGMTQNEKQFINDTQQRRFQLITGDKIWSIVKAQEKKQHINEIVDQSLKKIEDNIQQASKHLDLLFTKVTEQLQTCNNKVETYFKSYTSPKKQKQIQKEILLDPFNLSTFPSKIVKTEKQLNAIQSFFDQRKIKSSRLIYRASQNDFDAWYFHQKCDNIPDTLVLVETDKGKKLGGYTPIRWQSANSYASDKSRASFLFSLTSRDKFQLIKPEYAVYHSLKQGPTFGLGYDLFISNKANYRQNSFAMINHAYVNKKYTLKNMQSSCKFTGSYTCHFLTQEWEVWKLEFDSNGTKCQEDNLDVKFKNLTI